MKPMRHFYSHLVRPLPRNRRVVYLEPAQGCGCGVDHEKEDGLMSPHEIIVGWLAENNPAALELCPFKVVQPAETPPPDGWEADYYEARLVSTFETLAKIDNVEVSEVVGAFIAGYFADRIERAEQS